MPNPSELGTKAGKLVPIKPIVPPVTRIIPLAKDQYYQTVYEKKFIFLHHTAGGSAAGAIASWSSDPQNVATPYVIERSGDIYELYDPKYWAYSLGVKGQTAMEKASIPIEIVSYGNLTKKNGKWFTYTNREMLPPSEVLEIDFRGYKAYQKYSDAQIKALSELLPYLIDRFKIPLQTQRANFWDYRNPTKLPSGIWSHTTVRKDKVDIFPQQNLIDLVYGL